jgi:hypothetical protein
VDRRLSSVSRAIVGSEEALAPTALTDPAGSAVNGTILHLEKRKQHSKLKMFKNLHRILMCVDHQATSASDWPGADPSFTSTARGAVCAVGGFFILSAITLSDRGSDDFAPRSVPACFHTSLPGSN